MGKESEVSDLPLIYPRLQGLRMEELGQESWLPFQDSILAKTLPLSVQNANTPLQTLRGSRELF